jgi:gliding motility-associated-like protein
VLELPEVRILGEQVCEDWTEVANFVTPANGKFTCSFGCDDGKFSPLLASRGTAGSVSLTYTFTATNGCENSDKKTIEIVNLPNTPIVNTKDETEVCEDNVKVNLQTDVPEASAANYTYRWRRDMGVLPSEDSSAYMATKAGSYDVRICNKGLCWSNSWSDPISIFVKPLPTPPVIAAENAAFYCPGESTTLIVNDSELGSFLWYKGDNREMSEIPGEITESYSANEVGQYAVKLFGEKGCWSPFSNFITVGEYPLPKQPEIIASQTTLYAGLDYKLLVKSPQTDETYEWYKSNLSIDASGVTVPISNLNGDDTGRYTVRVTDQHGCVVESEAYELGWSETDLFIPNVFTPNGDGINDNFQILGLDRFVEHKLQIMNKQRVVIFTQKNYSNEWNGSGYLNDVYYYILELKHQDGGKKTVYGYVHLKR